MFIYSKELKILKENKEYINAIIDNFKELMENTKFSYRYKDLEIIQDNKKTILTIKVLGHDDKPFATIKLGNYICDNWSTTRTKDTIRINKTENLDLVYHITHFAKMLSRALVKLYKENDKNE